MNSLYHLAILEGYLAQHPELPRNVQDAIAHFKAMASPTPVAETKKRRKWKPTPEQREKMLANLAKMREAKGERFWNQARIDKVREMRASGKSVLEIAKDFGRSEKAVYAAIKNHGI